MSVLLKVPFVTQLGIGSHAAAGSSGKKYSRDDPTGCWYASACMVAYYFKAGPRLGVPEIFKKNLGDGVLGHFPTGSQQAINACANHHDLLAQRESLVPVARCSDVHNYKLDTLEELLRKNGPIFMYWTKPHGTSSYGHASVIIGTSSTGIIYHDPENAPSSKMTLSQFNTRRQKWKYALMQRKAESGIAARKAMFGG